MKQPSRVFVIMEASGTCPSDCEETPVAVFLDKASADADAKSRTERAKAVRGWKRMYSYTYTVVSTPLFAALDADERGEVKDGN